MLCCNFLTMMNISGIIVANILLILCKATEIEDPIVATNHGLVKGQQEYSRSGRAFYSFKGIPYAKPPVGDLRFKPPQEPENWTDTLEAQADAPHCLQKNYLFANPKVEGSEDCLYLNVYTPKLRARRHNVHSLLLPVMVFIHWGGFFTGYSSSDYIGPEYLMDQNVVLVTFNYRLAVLGFLSTNDDVAPGNYGLKDQVAVLNWVQSNIHSFGGNRNKVTIFGQSAGAASVHYHMLSPMSKNLFHQGISQSGSALALWAQPQAYLQLTLAKAQAAFVGCTEVENSTQIIDCLRKVDGEKLVDSGDKFKFFAVDPLNVFVPSIEVETANNPEPFITKQPVEYIRDKEFSNVPWIVGSVNEEGLIRAEPLIRQSKTRADLNANFDNLMPNLMGLSASVPTDEIPNTWTKIKDFYFFGHNAIEVFADARGLINLYSDRSFAYSTYQSTMFHHLNGHKDIWFYNFNYSGQYSYGDKFAATQENIQNFTWGVSHCDDLLYLFGTPALFPPLTCANDQLLIKNMVEMWTNFAIYGNPTPSEGGVNWTKIDGKSSKSLDKKIFYLSVTGKCSSAEAPKMNMKYGVYKNRFKFWEDISLAENIEELNQTHIDL